MNTKFKLLLFIKLVTIVCSTISVCLANTTTDSVITTKIKVDVYYETLCKDSIVFLVNQVVQIYGQLEKIIDLKLLPFGKSMPTKTKDNKIEFDCQHGSRECRGNVIQACALKQSSWNNTRTLPFIDCMERIIATKKEKRKTDIDTVAKKCAKPNNFSFADLDACASGQDGIDLMLEIGNKTLSIKPKITYIPMIAINGIQSKEAERNFVRIVCLEYKKQEGTKNIPEICSK